MNYAHEGMPEEIVSAKAKAILAAKNGTSLILAVKAGTGKTHLATAIAEDEYSLYGDTGINPVEEDDDEYYSEIDVA